jgi:hypothetical protein
MKLAGKKGLTHHYIIPDTLNGPEPDPEYHECKRCGVRLARTSLLEECEDCKGLNARKASNSEQRYISGNFLPIDPAYEVSLHFPNVSVSWDDRTVATLASLRIPYFSYYGTKDPIEFEYAEKLPYVGWAEEYPIVLITKHGEPIDWWRGFALHKLNAIPSARAAATTPSAHSVPDSQEQAA